MADRRGSPFLVQADDSLKKQDSTVERNTHWQVPGEGHVSEPAVRTAEKEEEKPAEEPKLDSVTEKKAVIAVDEQHDTKRAETGPKRRRGRPAMTEEEKAAAAAKRAAERKAAEMPEYMRISMSIRKDDKEALYAYALQNKMHVSDVEHEMIQKYVIGKK